MESHYQHFLDQALAHAELGKGTVAPNPAVGAVVVRADKVLAAGYHRGPGFPHAEVEALHPLGSEAVGSTVYVTLEPCCHWGRTPPCTDLLIERKVKRVVYAMQDPNPLVAGQGAEKLRAHGIEVIHQPTSEISRFYRSYVHWTKTGLPYVTAKLALTLNGKTAGPEGERRKITSEALDRENHLLRKSSDAILTTARTVLADDPMLNVRLTSVPQARPVYILDRLARLEGKSPRCFVTAKNAVLFASSEILSKREGLTWRYASQDNGHLSLPEVLRSIGSDGVHDLLVEAGGTLFESLLHNNLLQVARVSVSPLWWEESALPAFSVERPQVLFADVKEYTWKTFGPEALCEMVW